MPRSTPLLLYLNADDVRAAMPDAGERLELARRTMIALVDDARMPPKLGADPRPAASHTAAMPAWLRGTDDNGTDDLLGMKWVTAFPTNRELGVPTIHATVLLTDALTGQPRAVLDGAPITAERTAAVSGVALREWWPRDIAEPHVVILGAGVQGKAHVDVLIEVCRQLDAHPSLTVADRHLDRAQHLAETVRNAGIPVTANGASDLVAAAREADVLMTMISFGPERQMLPMDALARASLVVGVDYDMSIPAEYARGSSIFLTDDIPQFQATRTGASLAGYPDPDASIGEALLGRAIAARQSGPTYVNHLGVGLADIVFADAIVRRATTRGIGTTLS
jgi:ornithine cyclodeaminase/alanine dehydrogenase-like protein (mu-crystallin family)